VDAKPNHATRTLVHYDENPMCSQCGGFAAEQIATPQKLSFVWPRNVSQDGPPDSGR
jgi:hypothetical protein